MQRKRTSRRAFFEPLEPRQMMAIVPVEGTPFWNFPGNHLPQQTYLTSPPAGFLSQPASGTPLQIAQNYLSQNKAAYGLSAADLTHYNVTDNYQDEETGVTHIYIQQTYNGLPIADALGSIHVTAAGQVLAASANFVRNLSYPPANGPLTPDITADDALNAFANTLNATAGVIVSTISSQVSPATGLSQKTILTNPDLSLDPIPVELHFVAAPEGGVELSWRIIARSPGMPHWFDLSVAASGGRAGTVTRVADWVEHASYNVFAAPVQDPLFGNRSIVTDPHSVTASPFGWHDNNGTPAPDFTDTRGNNVLAQEDRNGDDLGGFRPQGGPNLVFDFPLNLANVPPTYESAAITNLFYWTNLSHDVSANHGFTERAGNFQIRNYSGRGLGNDPVIADAQDLFALNNAFMATPPEGQSPNLVMGQFTLTNPARDSDLMGVIISHEFGHGISNRLTGGPANASALQAIQSRGMGEGWSDWFALLLTMKPTDNRNTPRTHGQWVLGQPVTGPGIRRFPISFDMAIDPLTLNNFNGDSFPGQNNSQVHNAGEIWQSALWDMTWLLIEKYGFSTDLYNGNGGQNIAMKLVFDGMRLQPANPSFLEARDAIILADKMRTGGQNFAEIWTAFSRRGFGASASDGPDAFAITVSGTFDSPPIPITVSGTVFNDADGDGTRDANEGPLSGWTVFNDANNNAALDNGEARTVSSASGSYSFTFFTGQTVRLREVVQPNWQVTAPPGGVHVLNVALGQNLSNVNFGNQMIAGSVSGVKFNDLNGNAARDSGEPGIEGVVVYADLNNDGRVGILEPAAVTDRFGNFTIRNIRPGTYNIREVFQPGMVQTFPDPAGTALGAHLNIVVASNQVRANINFGNRVAIDFGDAPTAAQSGRSGSYPTTLANNGARHGVLPGFGLGTGAGPALVDAELDGQPSAAADGDGADENGVVVPGLTPGSQATITGTVSLGGFSAGLLQGFFDWNRDGDWNDAGEHAILDRPLSAGPFSFQIAVPSSASLGTTFARFRYGYERGLGPTGSALAGEVEDYLVTVLANIPVANNDFFGAAFGTQLVKQGSTSNRLDVLANDFGVQGPGGVTIPPDIVVSTLPATSTRGGTLAVLFDTTLNRNVILYTPPAGALGIDTFQYQVSAGTLVSSFATVTIDITAGDPRAVDDTRTFSPTDTFTLNVRNNDLPSSLTIVSAQTLTPGAPANTFTVNATGTDVTFTPPTGFRGTLIGQYTIDDQDPQTLASTARITVQVVDGGLPAASHLAQFSVEFLDTNGVPISMVSAGSDFLVRVSTQDLRPGGAFFDRGVLTAYMDVLFNSSLARPVVAPSNPLGFDIQFAIDPNSAAGTPTYSFQQSGEVDPAGGGIIDEVGGSYSQPAPAFPAPGRSVPAFTIRMRANSSGELIVRPDPADSNANPDNRVVVLEGTPLLPVVITDEQVFLKEGRLQILGSGEGEFTNFRNPLDVSADGFVSALDALMVFNDINANGSRSLSQLSLGMSGQLPPQNLLDVNFDANVTPLDALLVINHLNGSLASSRGSGEGESAEGESQPLAAAVADAPAAAIDGGLVTALNAVLPPLAASNGSNHSEPVATQNTTATANGTAAPVTRPPASERSLARRLRQLEADAADEVFSSLGDLGTSLRSRFLRR